MALSLCLLLLSRVNGSDNSALAVFIFAPTAIMTSSSPAPDLSLAPCRHLTCCSLFDDDNDIASECDAHGIYNFFSLFLFSAHLILSSLSILSSVGGETVNPKKRRRQSWPSCRRWLSRKIHQTDHFTFTAEEQQQKKTFMSSPLSSTHYVHMPPGNVIIIIIIRSCWYNAWHWRLKRLRLRSREWSLFFIEQSSLSRESVNKI